MNPLRRRKLIGIVLILLALAAAAALILFALRQNINLFYTPTQLQHAHVQANTPVRIGGYVQKHSVQYDASGASVNFAITDRLNNLRVNYQGVLPTLFREGQGVVVTGHFNQAHQFIADQVLAKHDAKYMPASVAKMLAAQARPRT